MVFNWPVDTVNAFHQYGDGKYHYKPIDKKSNYVKRCVGLPGDSLEVRDGYVYINGEKNVLPDRAKLQFSYASAPKKRWNTAYISQRYGITDIYPADRDFSTYIAHMTDEAFEKFKNYPDIVQIVPLKGEPGVWDKKTFPHNEQYSWNSNFFGPMYIPQKGATVDITIETIPLYKRIIEVYEGS